MWKHDSGEAAVSSLCTSVQLNNCCDFCSKVAHFDTVSLVVCLFPGARWGADRAYVGETDGVDSDPLPSMLSCGG